MAAIMEQFLFAQQQVVIARCTVQYCKYFAIYYSKTCRTRKIFAKGPYNTNLLLTVFPIY